MRLFQHGDAKVEKESPVEFQAFHAAAEVLPRNTEENESGGGGGSIPMYVQLIEKPLSVPYPVIKTMTIPLCNTF